VFPDGGFPTNPAAEGAIPDRVTQPGPGGLYAPLAAPSPDYSRPGIGIRPISDYAPPGYQRTDPQGGIGMPLYRPIRVPTPEQMPTDLERDKFVTRGLFPGTYLVPGTNTSFKWYGFVRLDAIFDFNPIGGTDSFVTAQIPVPQGRGQNFAANPRYSRLGLDTWTPTSLFDWAVHTRIEVDFFNGNNSGLFGSYPLRLRYAYADFGPFRLGQAASTFMDYDVFPNVLDYQGPNGMVLMRQVIARVTLPVADQLHVALAVEQPYSDIQWFQDGEFVVNPGSGIVTTAGAPRNVQDVPDFTGHVRYDTDLGHLQVSGIVRKLTFQPAVGSDMNRLGTGVNLTGDLHPWALLNQSSPDKKGQPECARAQPHSGAVRRRPRHQPLPPGPQRPWTRRRVRPDRRFSGPLLRRLVRRLRALVDREVGVELLLRRDVQRPARDAPRQHLPRGQVRGGQPDLAAVTAAGSWDRVPLRRARKPGRPEGVRPPHPDGRAVFLLMPESQQATNRLSLTCK
jgi:hypothetical protein